MDVFLLPEKVKSQLAGISAGGPPLSILRSSSCLEGTLGESYLVEFPASAHLFSKKLGEDNYKRIDVPLSKGAAVSVSLRKEGFDALLDIESGGARHSLKFSSFEAMTLEPLVKKWSALLGGSNGLADKAIPAARQTAKPPAQLSPLAGLAAALMFAATSDGEISEVEDEYIRRVCKGKDSDLRAGFNFYKSHKASELPAALGKLEHEQCLCIVANLCEACMADGLFKSGEQQLVKDFAEALGVAQDEYETVRDVLILKNRIAALYGGTS